jgi:hypothetical protein
MKRRYVIYALSIIIALAIIAAAMVYAADPYQYERAWLPAIVSSPPPTATIDWNAPTPTPPNPGG